MIYSENVRFINRKFEFRNKHGDVISNNEAFKKALNRINNWWLDFKLFLIHLISLHIPFWCIRRAVFKISGIKIGKGSTIHMGCKFFEPKNIIIGEDTIVGDRVFLDGRDTLKIGSHVDIASEVMIYNSEHNIKDPKFEAKSDNVEIGDYVFIGPRVIILPGVLIGKGSVIAAGAVVTDNVKDFQIVGGVPAKFISLRNNTDLNYHLGRARLFQ